MGHYSVVILALLFVNFLSFSQVEARSSLPALQALAAEGYEVSGLIVDMDTGETLASLDAEKLVIPASVTKLYTAARALEYWGADYRFETDILIQGNRKGDVLNGNMVLKGAGDPSLTNEDLWRLALNVAQSGISRITGDLIIDESRFGRVPCVTKDRCKAEKKTWRSYDSLLSAASVNHGNVAVVVSPGARIGDPASVYLDPYPIGDMEISGTINTVKGYGAQHQVSRFTNNGVDSLAIGGSIGINAGTHRSYRSVGEPARLAGELFREFLVRAGVSLQGNVRVTTEQVPGERLTGHLGQPVNQIIGDMLYYSNNMIADVITLNLFVENEPDTRHTLPAAGEFLQEYARKLTGKSRFTSNASGARLFDGSGLNPDNRLNAHDLVALLDHVYAQPGDFPFFLGAMRVPAQSPSRGLSGVDTVLKRISTKTGGLSEPVSVHTLAGYIRLDNGHWGAFAFLVNGTRSKRIYRVKAFEAIRKDLKNY